jgi:hypothetical protein
MPFFKIKNENKLVITNFKVMFSSFKKTSHFTKIKRYHAYFNIKCTNPTAYFVVRDPYQKAASFYKDKFQLIPQRADLSKPFKWEKPQRVFFPGLGLSVKNNTDEEIAQTLINTSFETFIELLADCYHLDEHIHPQHWVLNHPQYWYLPNLNINAKSLNIFKMDDAEGIQQFSTQTGFDNAQRANSTKAIGKIQPMNANILGILNRIYQQDFEKYNYPMQKAS